MRKRIDNALADVRNDLELIKTIVMIREPATVESAKAFDGLRKAVIAGAAERTAHLQQLARLDAEVSFRGADIEAIKVLLRDLLAEAGLQRVNECHDGITGAFDDVGGKGDSWRVVVPAYLVDGGQGAPVLVRTGKAERVESVSSTAASTAPHVAEPEASTPHELVEMVTANDVGVEAGR